MTREVVHRWSAPEALFKHSKFSNYFFKKSTITISNALNTKLFIKNLPFKVLKECPGALVNISFFLICIRRYLVMQII